MKLQKLNFYLTILKIVLIATGVISCIFLLGGPEPEGLSVKDFEAFRDGPELALATGFTGFILFLGVAMILFFFVVQMISNPKRTFISIAGLIAALAVYLIILMIGTADTNETLQLREESMVDLSTINASTAGLWTAIIGVVVAILAVLAGAVMKLKK